MKNKPLISVIMLVYNASNFVRATIEGILNQTEQDFEFIILNDCSTDDTENIVLSYSSDKIRYYKNPKNLGTPGAYNEIYKLVRGEYIAISEHDDVSHPQRLEIQANFMRDHPSIGGVCGQQFVGSPFTYKIQPDKVKVVRTPEQVRSKQMFQGLGFYNPSAMIKTKDLKQSGVTWDTTLPPVQDIYFYQRLAMTTDLTILDCVLIFRHEHAGKNTRNKEIRAKYPTWGQETLGTKKFLKNYFDVDISNVLDNGARLKSIDGFYALNDAVEKVVKLTENDPKFCKKMLQREAVYFLYRKLRYLEKNTNNFGDIYTAYRKSNLLRRISIGRRIRFYLKSVSFPFVK